MAIAKKGSRRIHVGDTHYRWAVRLRPTYSQGLAWTPLTFAVEPENGVGATLVVKVNAARPDNWLGERGAVVTPVIVERAINEALRQGWQPAQNGSAFELAFQPEPDKACADRRAGSCAKPTGSAP